MQTAVRNPLFTSSVALLTASVVAVTPTTSVPVPSMHAAPTVDISVAKVRTLEVPVQLSASVADILTFPILRQYIRNRIDDILTLGVGLAGSGVAAAAALGQLPQTLALITQQILSGQFEAALNTIIDSTVDTVAAVGGPTLNAVIERRERYAQVVLNLQSAVPEAVIGLANHGVDAVDAVLTSWINGGQIIAGALFNGNLGDLLPAVVDAAGVVAKGFADGGQSIVDGIVFAQQTIAVALGATPAPIMALSGRVAGAQAADVPDISGKATTLSLNVSADTGDPGTATAGVDTKSDADPAAGIDTKGDSGTATGGTDTKSDATPAADTGKKADTAKSADTGEKADTGRKADTGKKAGTGKKADTGKKAGAAKKADRRQGEPEKS